MKAFKKFMFVIPMLTVLLIYSASCQKNDDEGLIFNRDRLIKIANDPLYIEFHKLDVEKQKHIINSAFDLEMIKAAIFDLIENPDTKDGNMCNAPDKIFKNIKGGALYKELGCKRYQLKLKIEEKYPGIWQSGSQNLLELKLLCDDNIPEEIEERRNLFEKKLKNNKRY